MDLLDPEAIERDDPVDAAIARSPNALEIAPARAVPHLVEEIQDDGLEEGRRDVAQGVEQFGSGRPSQLGERGLEAIIRARGRSLLRGAQA